MGNAWSYIEPPTTVAQFDMLEIALEGPEPTGSHVSVDLEVDFVGELGTTTVRGFYAGAGRYLVRFMPLERGEWRFASRSAVVPRFAGTFVCGAARDGQHGPVRASGLHFAHADGTPFSPFGTTLYAWTHQEPELVAQTCRTLATSPFNKVRMCVFPKSMAYNSNEPALFPFAKRPDGTWDVHAPVPEFWDLLEESVLRLADMGIQADLILFHPYDRWGLAELSREDNLAYLDYCVRRLGALGNIWWSLANEYDLVFNKTAEDWEAFGRFIGEADVFGHLLSVHNWLRFYDFRKPWVTHCSIQSTAVHNTDAWRAEYGKPVINDEFRYEGDIEEPWGHLSGFDLIHHLWATVLKGGYGTHGETFRDQNDVLWWAKGGDLHGESPARIAFLRQLVEEIGGVLEPVPDRFGFDPNAAIANLPPELADNPHLRAFGQLDAVEWEHFRHGAAKYHATAPDGTQLRYLADSCQSIVTLELPTTHTWTIEVIDVWEMTQTPVPGARSGRTTIELPGHAGMAVLARPVAPAADAPAAPSGEN